MLQIGIIIRVGACLRHGGGDSLRHCHVLQTQVAQQVEIEVADRGVGIPPEDLLRVFDKFYRVHRPDNVAGTGLGLSICKGIVEAHGGRIAAENRPGGGTVIRFTLPVAEVTVADGVEKNGRR